MCYFMKRQPGKIARRPFDFEDSLISCAGMVDKLPNLPFGRCIVKSRELIQLAAGGIVDRRWARAREVMKHEIRGVLRAASKH